MDKGTPFYGIPNPGTYILDRRGVVKSKFFEDDYRVRDTAASIVLRQFGITPEKHETARGKHVDLAISASDQRGPAGPAPDFLDRRHAGEADPRLRARSPGLHSGGADVGSEQGIHAGRPGVPAGEDHEPAGDPRAGPGLRCRLSGSSRPSRWRPRTPSSRCSTRTAT